MDGRTLLESVSSTENGPAALQKLFSLKHVDGALDTSIVGASDERLLEFQAKLVRVQNLGATPEDIRDYINAITQDKVQIAEGSRTYLDNVIDDNDLVKFRSDLFEAKTAAKYGAMGDTVKLIIEPLKDEADILVVKNNGEKLYLNAKDRMEEF